MDMNLMFQDSNSAFRNRRCLLVNPLLVTSVNIEEIKKKKKKYSYTIKYKAKENIHAKIVSQIKNTTIYD